MWEGGAGGCRFMGGSGFPAPLLTCSRLQPAAPVVHGPPALSGFAFSHSPAMKSGQYSPSAMGEVVTQSSRFASSYFRFHTHVAVFERVTIMAMPPSPLPHPGCLPFL